MHQGGLYLNKNSLHNFATDHQNTGTAVGYKL